MEEMGFIYQCLKIPAGPFTMLCCFCVKRNDQLLITDHQSQITIFSQRGAGRGGGLGRDRGVGVGLGATCTSKGPMSIRPFLTRSKPGPRWS